MNIITLSQLHFCRRIFKICIYRLLYPQKTSELERRSASYLFENNLITFRQNYQNEMKNRINKDLIPDTKDVEYETHYKRIFIVEINRD